MKKRSLSIVLSLALCLSLLPNLSLTASAAADTHTHPVCGETHTDIGDHTAPCEAVEYQPLSEVLTKVEGDSNSYYYGTLDGGSYYVDLKTMALKDPGVTGVYAAITVKGEVNLCLNGNTLQGYGDASGGLFYLFTSSSVLTLCDCGQDGTITGARRSSSGAAVNASSRTFRMFGGAITGNTATREQGDATGGGVYLSNSGVFKMYGGAITGNTADAGGADVWSDNPVVLSGAANIGKLYVNASNVMRDTYPAIQLSGALTGEASITLEKIGSHGVVAEGVNDYTVTASDAAKITPPANSGTLLVDAPNNRLVLGTDFADATVTLSQTAFTYNREEQKPVITVQFGNTTLEENVHYTVEWPEDTTNAGTKTVTVHGKFEGNSKYAGSKTVEYTIGPKAITPVVEGVQESYPYTGSAVQPTVTVKEGEVVLTEGTDYDMTYDTNTNVATGGSVTVTLKGNYSGSATKNFAITKVDASIAAAPTGRSLTYSGGEQDLVDAGTATGGTMQYALGIDSDAAPTDGWSNEIPQATDIGTYYVWYKVAGDDNHNDSAPANLSVTIARATPTIAWANTTETVEYTGEAASITAPTVRLVGSDSYGGAINYSYTGTSDGEQVSGSGLPTNAGTYTITASIDAQGSYTEASATTPLSLTISPKSVTVNAEAKTKKFGDADPALTYTAPDLVSGETLTGTLARDAGEDVGTYAIGQGTVTNENNPNYNISYTSANLTITEADALSISPVVKQFVYTTATTGNVVDIAALLPSDRGDTSYTYTVSDDTSILVLDTDAVSDDGKLTFGTKTAENEVNATITVTAAMLNYADTAITVTVKLVDKTPVTITGVTAQNGTYNGSAQRGYTGTPSSAYTGTYEITYTGRGNDYNSTTAPTNAGDYTVTFKVPDSDQTYIGSVSLDFSIGKATITVTAKNQSIYVGGTAPDLSSPALNTHYTVTGLASGDTLGSAITMEYQTDGTTATPDTTKTGSYDIVISGATVPNDTNYSGITFANGTLTISNRPSSGGSTTTTTKTEKNEDGSTTTTTTNRVTGTVTETTKNTDGSTTTVETKKDGSVTETNKTSDGTTGTVKTDADGTVTEVTATVPAAAANEAAENGEPVTLPVEVPAAESSEDAVELTVNIPSGGATVEIPVEDVTPGTVVVIVNADGTETIVKKSTVSEDGVVVALEGDATIKIIDNSRYFEDVHSVDHWATDAIDFVAARTIFNGTSATTFHPNESMTRGMLAVALHNLEDNPDHDYEGAFHDVEEDSWYEDAIHWAADEGIVSGYGNGNYGPNDNITREQLAVMLWRYAGSPEVDHDLSHFTDEDQISGYAREALEWANENGIINGKGNGILDPKGEATRAEVAQMLMNYLINVLK